MLVKLQSRTYTDDFGMLVDGERPYIHMFESGIVRLGERMRPRQVVKVKARWMDKDVKVECKVAATDQEKRQGLQGYSSLEENEGLYFPYPGYCDVVFHQGSVGFPLDVIFLRDGEVLALEESTRVGGVDRWSCEGCDGVVEVNAGFASDKGVDVGDRVLLLAYSQQDLDAYHKDRLAVHHETILALREESLLHAIEGEDLDY